VFAFVKVKVSNTRKRHENGSILEDWNFTCAHPCAQKWRAGIQILGKTLFATT
jgi:hypothetical protein